MSETLKNGNHIPTNPWTGRLVNIAGPFSGTLEKRLPCPTCHTKRQIVQRTPWTRWDIETPEMNLACFSEEIADIAAKAIIENLEVCVIWKLRKNKKRPDYESCELVDLHIKET